MRSRRLFFGEPCAINSPVMSFRQRLLVAFAFLPASHAFAQSGDCLHWTVPVTIVNRNGALVEGLTASDFRAGLRGKPVRILSVAKDDRPHRIVILLDVSGSMFGVNGTKWSLAWASAFHLAQSNLPKTSLALLVFRTDIVERVDFSQGTTAVSERLKQIGEDVTYKKNIRGQTALFDTVIEGLKLLGPPTQGDVIYVITDGGDNKSRNSPREVQHALESAGVRLYALILSHLDGRMPNTPEEEYGKSNLLQVIDATGGMQFEPIELSPFGARLYKDERLRIAMGLQDYYEPMVHPYLVQIELPGIQEKPTGWRLKLSDEKNHKVKGGQVAYPRELMPCTLVPAN